MDSRSNRQVVDTFHPSVNVVLNTRNSQDVTIYNTVKRNRATFPLANAIQGSDVMKVSYLHVARVVMPVTWWNVTTTSYLRFQVDNDTAVTGGVYVAKPKAAFTGQLSLAEFVALINNNAAWTITTIEGDDASAVTALPFHADLAYGRIALSLITVAGFGDITTDDITCTLFNTTTDGTLITDYLIQYMGARTGDGETYQMFNDHNTAANTTTYRFPCIASVQPYKFLRIQTTSIPQNTPVTSSFLPNAFEIVPVEADFGSTIVFEPTQAFHMQVPQLILTSLDIQILDEYGNDVNFRGGDWSISFIVDFVNRNLEPPQSGLVMPVSRSTNPMDRYNKRKAQFDGSDTQDILPSKASRTYGAPSVQL